jgi:hypothetical protein
MSNGSDMQRNHTRFIVACITVMGIVCAAVGGILIYKGYHADLLISGVIAAISGMTGLLGQSKPNPPPPDITVSSPPPKVEVTQPERQP